MIINLFLPISAANKFIPANSWREKNYAYQWLHQINLFLLIVTEKKNYSYRKLTMMNLFLPITAANKFIIISSWRVWIYSMSLANENKFIPAEID